MHPDSTKRRFPDSFSIEVDRSAVHLACCGLA
jgi:hypothetical protein